MIEGVEYLKFYYPYDFYWKEKLLRESRFQSDLIVELRDLFTGCIVLKNDSSYLQGVPDLLILYKDKWATLECKMSLDSPVQPNQAYYVDLMSDMSFSAFITPDNKEDILSELQQAFGIRRKSRLPQR